MGLHVAVNVSAVQFAAGDLVETVEAALAQSGLPAGHLELEITEGILLHDSEATLATLHRLRALGVRISMDDFGTGYSSLSYLHKFPFDKIKIDQAFVRAIADADGHYPVILAIISIARGLGLRLIAEGVETETQIAYLERNGCTTIQGYFYSPAISCAQFIRLLQERQARRA